MYLKFLKAHEGCREGDVVRFESRREAEAILAQEGVAVRCTAEGKEVKVQEVSVVDNAGTGDGA